MCRVLLSLRVQGVRSWAFIVHTTSEIAGTCHNLSLVPHCLDPIPTTPYHTSHHYSMHPLYLVEMCYKTPVTVYLHIYLSRPLCWRCSESISPRQYGHGSYHPLCDVRLLGTWDSECFLTLRGLIGTLSARPNYKYLVHDLAHTSQNGQV
jgi:hypothetical protein